MKFSTRLSITYTKRIRTDNEHSTHTHTQTGEGKLIKTARKARGNHLGYIPRQDSYKRYL